MIVHEYESEGLTLNKGGQNRNTIIARPCATPSGISKLEYAPAGGKKVHDWGVRARFRLYRRGKKRKAWEAIYDFADPTDEGKVAFVGGYLHPNGKFALLKFSSTSTDVGSTGREVHRFTRFVFVDLKTEIVCHDTRVLDLAPLAGLNALANFDLKNTQVSDARVKKLQGRLPKLRINH